MADVTEPDEGVGPADDPGPASGGRHTFVFVLVGLLLAGLVGGLATVGLGGDPPNTQARSEGPRGACQAHELEYYVTDDATEYDRQVAFERSNAPIADPGFHDAPLEPVASLHAASHGYVVVFYRPELGDEVMAGLRSLQSLGLTQDAPVLTVPRDQADAVVAIASEWELQCPEATVESVRETVRFAAETYPTLGKAEIRSATP